MDNDTRPRMAGGPCIRGLKQFKKCPGKSWDGKEGCPCWFEAVVSVFESGSKKEVIRKQCIDIWQYDFLWWTHARISGVQETTETFRNAMCELNEQGTAVPKTSEELKFLCNVIAVNQTVKPIPYKP